MHNNIAAAVFRDMDTAERAITELKASGVPGDAISVIKLDENHETRRTDGDHHEHDDSDSKGSGIGKGLAAGGALGAIAGLGALVIPGIGPFIAAGALAEALGVAGSAAVVSGAVGAAAGGLTGALIDYGVDRDHAEYYEKRIREGAVFVAVDTTEHPTAYAPARGILRAAGGESADREEHADTHA